jgi:hypothetical protein
MNARNNVGALQFDDLDRFLIGAAIEIGRIADDVCGALLILAYYADGDDCGITSTALMDLMGCDASRLVEALSILDSAEINVPGGWRPSP